MPIRQPGKLIMLDGPDGVGKTTQIAKAKAALEAQKYRVYTTRTHGGTPIGELLRQVSFNSVDRQPLTDHYISMAIHSELRSDIAKHRADGEVILVDRSPLSNWAYQVHGSGLQESYALDDIKRSMALFAADLIICYEAPLVVLRQHTGARANAPEEDYFESKSDAYFQGVIEGYRAAADMFGASMVDATGSIDEVHTTTMHLIEQQLVKAAR